MIKGGDVAQLGEHLVRNEGVGGSSPLISTFCVCVEIVLDGEVAVPCNPQPAIAGLNSLLRSCLFGKAAGVFLISFFNPVWHFCADCD
mgnify:CR=1 FL=1